MAADLEALKTECLSCDRCPLGATRQNLVFGDGCPTAEIMLIGEGPGEKEDEQGVPFVGPAGKLLDDMLEIIHLNRSNVYIANIVKCRPPRNRDPQVDEQAACKDWLRQQVALVQPKIIICLGRIAAQALIDPEFRITRDHGQWVEKAGVHMTAIYHPSALLRDPDKRPDTFLDLKSIQQKVREVCPNTPI